MGGGKREDCLPTGWKTGKRSQKVIAEEERKGLSMKLISHIFSKAFFHL